jgi:thymidine phosphorylase
VKPGEPIRGGGPLCRIHARTALALEHALTTASAAFQINETPAPGSPLIREVILPPNPPRARAEE